MRNYFIDIKIVPSKIIFRRSVIRIRRILNPCFVIRGYNILCDGRNLYRVYLQGDHPNQDPKSKEFCIPNMLKKKEISKDLILHLERSIRTYNLDDCYFSPWQAIETEEEYDGRRTRSTSRYN